MIKEEILQKIRKDNDLTLDLAKKLQLQQMAVFVRIDRNSKTFRHDIRVIEFLKENGFTDEEIFEVEPVAYKSISNN